MDHTDHIMQFKSICTENRTLKYVIVVNRNLQSKDNLNCDEVIEGIIISILIVLAS